MAGTQSVSGRLQTALERRGKNLSWLHEQVEESGVRGSSYGSVYAYVKDESKTEPPLEFLREAADVLGVRHAWLATGHGAMTEEEEEDRLRHRYSKPKHPQADHDLLEAVGDRHPWLRQLSIGAQQTLMDVLRGLEFQAPGGRDLRSLDVDGVLEERLELADDLVFALTLPLRLWGVSFPEILREEATVSMELPGPPVDVNGYVRQVLGALATVMTTRTPGDPLEQRHQSLVTALRRVAEADPLPEEAEPSDEERKRAARIQAALDERMEERRRKLDEEGLGFEPQELWPDTQEEEDHATE